MCVWGVSCLGCWLWDILYMFGFRFFGGRFGGVDGTVEGLIGKWVWQSFSGRYGFEHTCSDVSTISLINNHFISYLTFSFLLSCCSSYVNCRWYFLPLSSSPFSSFSIEYLHLSWCWFISFHLFSFDFWYECCLRQLTSE